MELTVENPYLPLRRGLIALLQQLDLSGGLTEPVLSQLPKSPGPMEQELLRQAWSSLASLDEFYRNVGEPSTTTESEPVT